MSTVPGAQSWRDAGLAPSDTEQPLRLTDADPDAVPGTDSPEEYEPAPPRPDLAGTAEEADVVDQAAEVPVDDEGRDA